jgi:DNA-binding winged helix-turn-helix (wHTH) protein/Tol biopolymer transport system component
VPAVSSVYEFGAFRLDSAERLLLKTGQPIHLTPKAFDVLVYLVERHGRLVTKQELLSAIWLDTFVEEANLTFTVSALRKALDDGQNGEQLIQTVPTRGYRFVAPVTREGNPTISSTSETPAGSIQPLVRRIGIAALPVAVIAILVVLVRDWRETTEPLSRFTIPLPDSAVSAGSFPPARIVVAQISPDGKRVAFIVGSAPWGATVRRIWVRSLDALGAKEIPGSEYARSLFWAPDSQHLAFWTPTGLKTLRLSDGMVQTLCNPCHHLKLFGTWNRDGLIVLPSLDGSLFGIREGGGAPEALTRIDRSKGEIAHAAPQFLPDGQRFLFVIQNENPERSGLYVGQVGSTEYKLLFKGEQPAIYAAPGYLLFPLAGNLVARPFDLTRLEFRGDPLPLFPLSEFQQDWRDWIPISASDTGRLTHANFAFPPMQFQWMGRAGEPQRLVGEPDTYQSFDLSSDGKWLAVTRLGAGSSLWIIDVEHGHTSRLTHGDTEFTDPRWTEDNQRLVATRWRPSPYGIVQISRDGSESVISTSATFRALDDVSRDGRYVLYRQLAVELLAKPLREGSKADLVVRKAPAGIMDQAQFSPDGRWVAYNANETDRFEIYVTPFPAQGPSQLISSGGGVQPVWRADSRELYYLGLNGMLHAVELRPEGERLRVVDRELFQTGLGRPSSIIEQYAASADGQRFLIVRPVDNKVRTSIDVVFNWPALLTTAGSQ